MPYYNYLSYEYPVKRTALGVFTVGQFEVLKTFTDSEWKEYSRRHTPTLKNDYWPHQKDEIIYYGKCLAVGLLAALLGFLIQGIAEIIANILYFVTFAAFFGSIFQLSLFSLKSVVEFSRHQQSIKDLIKEIRAQVEQCSTYDSFDDWQMGRDTDEYKFSQLNPKQQKEKVATDKKDTLIGCVVLTIAGIVIIAAVRLFFYYRNLPQ